MLPNLAALVDGFRRRKNETAIVTYSGNRRTAASYGEIAGLADRFAQELMKRGIAEGDRVVLWGQNSATWVAAFFGCILRGVLAVPLDAAGSLEFARRVIEDTQPRLLVGDEILLFSLEDSVPQISLDRFAEILPARSTESLLSAKVNQDTPFQILFTSGTTAEPKGVVHMHRNVLASIAPIEREIQKYLRYERLVHPLRFLHTLPLSHVFGQFMGLWLPVLLGAEVHFESRLQPQRLSDLMREECISVLAAVPRVLQILKEHLLQTHPALHGELQKAGGESVWRRWWRFRKIHRQYGFKFWAFVCGGASLPLELESFWNTLGFALIQGYGMTETTALTTLNHPFKIGKGSIGKPLPGREIKITNEGEILVRGEMVSTATWQNGKLQRSDNEWLATGDLVKQDDAGQFNFLGRKSQMIVTSSGLNIYPEDVEVVLNRQTGVRAAVVIPDASAGGTEAMAVLLFQGLEDEAAKAVQTANAELASYQKIRRWLLWPDLNFPRSSTGKIQRGKVAQWAAAQRTVRDNDNSIANNDPLAELIAAISGARPQNISGTTRLDEDFRLDSLGRVQLQSELEQRFGITIDDATLARFETLDDLHKATGWHSQAAGVAPAEQFISPIEPGARESYPRWPWTAPISALRIVFVECVMRPLVWLLASPAVRRNAEFEAVNKPAIIIANHVTAYDGALVLYALPAKVRKHVAIAMAANLVEDLRRGRNQGPWFLNLFGPIGYWLITTLFNVFPLPRNAGFRVSFAHMGRALDRGYNILIFPEGHRSNGELQAFRAGIGLLVKESNAMVIPVALRGLGMLKSKKQSWFRSDRLEISVGVAMHFGQQQTAAEITSTLEETVRKMLREDSVSVGPAK